MKVEWKKALKDECIFAISEVKAGYIEGWQLFWAVLAAPVEVGIAFATGKGRWAMHHTRNARTQTELSRNGGLSDE